MLTAGHRRLLFSGARKGVGFAGSIVNYESKILAMWDAEDSNLITNATGVSSWTDNVAGIAVTQATTTKQPIWSATSFNGKAGVLFDAVDDILEVAPLPAAIPSGTTECEAWMLCSQDALTTDSVIKTGFAWGGGTVVDERLVQRRVSASANRAFVGNADGTTQHVVSDTAVNINTHHVIRCEYLATLTALTVDGAGRATVANNQITGTTRLRIGGNALNTANSWWKGQIAVFMITQPLAVDEAAQLLSDLSARK
jgi:hypothetical protein